MCGPTVSVRVSRVSSVRVRVSVRVKVSISDVKI